MIPEREHLLSTPYAEGTLASSEEAQGELFDDVPPKKRQLGLASAIFLIFNKVIGTGIFATPSSILRSSGSIGVALILWLLGAAIAMTGTAVYTEFGTGLPRNGGEKNYLEYLFKRPKFLTTCTYGVYAITLGSASPNSLAFGEYFLNALAISPTPTNVRICAVSILGFCLIMLGATPKLGLRLQNALGISKMLILFSIALAGALCLVGFPGFELQPGYEKPDNLRWSKLWEGSQDITANGFVFGLFNVIWSFVGYNATNYALSEVKNPVKTIKLAAPIAIMGVTTMYLLINIAYFAVVSKHDILESKRIMAALFFRNLFGPTMERVLSAFIALSLMGNLLAAQFAISRVIQELGREGVFPFSSILSSNAPFGAPLAAVCIVCAASLCAVLAVPAGDGYLLLINASSYAHALVDALISGGLVLLHTSTLQSYNWNPPFRASRLVIGAFLLSNIFLVAVPFIPPPPNKPRIYEGLPYWAHSAIAVSTALIGVVYWYIWSHWLPRKRGYILEREWVLRGDDVSRQVIRKVYPGHEIDT